MDLTREHVDFIRTCIGKWLRIYHQSLGRDPTEADVWHSSLLLRLLSGKEPLDKPPPLRHSRPDYALAEGEEVRIFEIFTDTYAPVPQNDEYVVVVDCHRAWRWISKEGAVNSKETPESGVLEYKDGTRDRFCRRVVTRKEVSNSSPDGFDTIHEEAEFLQKINE
jgi:hypothetical protein